MHRENLSNAFVSQRKNKSCDVKGFQIENFNRITLSTLRKKVKITCILKLVSSSKNCQEVRSSIYEDRNKNNPVCDVINQ